jgi:hypothetical protein
MLDIRPSAFSHEDGEPLAKAYDAIWESVDPARESPGPSYARLIAQPWVDARVVCTAAALAAQVWRKRGTRFSFVAPEVLEPAACFFASAMLGVVAGVRGDDRIQSWIQCDFPSDLGRELFVADAKEDLRDLLRHNASVHAGGLAFGVAYRKFAPSWGHRSSRGAPVLPRSPF